MVKKSDNDDDYDDDDDNNNDIDDNEGLKFGATEKNSKAADFFLGKNVAEASPEQVRRSFPDWKKMASWNKNSFWVKIIFHYFDEFGTRVVKFCDFSFQCLDKSQVGDTSL